MPRTSIRPGLPLLLVVLAVSIVTISGLRAQQAPPPFDVLITGGRIVDGTGAPWFKADVAFAGDRIVAIGQLAGRPARQTVDAAGLVVAPGFIDMLGQSEFNVLVDGRAASKIMQGVTTEITGEGQSIAPVNDRMILEARPGWDHFKVVQDFRTLAEYFQRLETRSRPAINIGTFVGAGGVRDYVIGSDDVPSTPATLDRMKALVAEAMKDGALGLSSSLQYVPDRFNSTDDLVEMAKVARSYGGVYLTHLRSESGKIDEALDETFAVAERANIPAEIWHLKTAYKANWGQDAGGAATDRGGPSARPRRHGEPVSLHPRVERPRLLPADLGARRHQRADAGAAQGPDTARSHQGRDGRSRHARTGRTSGTGRAAATG